MIRDHRSLTAWVLLASVLLGLFVCGIHQGQASGLGLSGLNGAFCSVGGEGAPGIGDGGSDGAAHGLACPLCSSFAAAVTADVGVHTFAEAAVAGALVLRPLLRAGPSPRHLRPSLSPRASPGRFLA